MLSQVQNAPPAGLISWCDLCGTTAVGMADKSPKNGVICEPDKHSWCPLAPFNGVHGNGNGNTKVKTTEPTLEPPSSPDAPPCVECGSLTKRLGSCYFCYNCNTTSGCS